MTSDQFERQKAYSLSVSVLKRLKALELLTDKESVQAEDLVRAGCKPPITLCINLN